MDKQPIPSIPTIPRSVGLAFPRACGCPMIRLPLSRREVEEASAAARAGAGVTIIRGMTLNPHARPFIPMALRDRLMGTSSVATDRQQVPEAAREVRSRRAPQPPQSPPTPASVRAQVFRDLQQWKELRKLPMRPPVESGMHQFQAARGGGSCMRSTPVPASNLESRSMEVNSLSSHSIREVEVPGYPSAVAGYGYSNAQIGRQLYTTTASKSQQQDLTDFHQDTPFDFQQGTSFDFKPYLCAFQQGATRELQQRPQEFQQRPQEFQQRPQDFQQGAARDIQQDTSRNFQQGPRDFRQERGQWRNRESSSATVGGNDSRNFQRDRESQRAPTSGREQGPRGFNQERGQRRRWEGPNGGSRGGAFQDRRQFDRRPPKPFIPEYGPDGRKYTRKERELLEQGQRVDGNFVTVFGPNYQGIFPEGVPIHRLSDGRKVVGHISDKEEYLRRLKEEIPLEEKLDLGKDDEELEYMKQVRKEKNKDLHFLD